MKSGRRGCVGVPGLDLITQMIWSYSNFLFIVNDGKRVITTSI